MEGASGAFAVVSVAIQLAETVQKLHAFWKTIQDAPSDVRELFAELSSLHGLLVRMGETSQNLDPSSEQLLTDCEAKILRLQRQLDGPLVDFRSSKYKRRKWGALKITLKKPFIDSILTSIEKTKSTLLLSRVYCLETHIIEIKNQNQALLDLARLTNLQTPPGIFQNDFFKARSVTQVEHCVEYVSKEIQSSPSYSAASSPFICNPQCGNISESDERQPHGRPHLKTPISTSIGESKVIVTKKHYNSSRTNIRTPLWSIHHRSVAVLKNQQADKDSSLEMNSSYSFYPSKLLRAMGMSYGICIETKAATGWQFSLQPFNAVPSDSPIFEFCREGNVAAIRTLLNGGHASLRDQDQKGRTPLWVAVEHIQLDTSKFLLEQGANTQIRDWVYHSLPISAVQRSLEIDVHKKLQIIDLISNHSPEGYDETTILYLIGSQVCFYRPLKVAFASRLSYEARQEAVLQVFKQLTPHLPPAELFWTRLIEEAIKLYHGKHVLHWALEYVQGRLQTTSTVSVLHQALSMKLLHRDPLSLQMIVEKTENLHLLFGGQRHSLIPISTPTFLTMYQPRMFMAWRSLLSKLEFDIDDFVRLELEQLSFLDDGWTMDTLTTLFTCELDPAPKLNGSGFFSCERCGQSESSVPIMIDLAWRRRLRDIRIGLNSGTKPSSVSHIQQMSPSSGIASASEYFEEILSDPKIIKPTVLPYSIVCSESCEDGVCVAHAVDNQKNDDPPLPLFGVKNVDVVEVVDGDQGLSKGVPGSFID